ncbi:hypothetical protein KJ819_00045 [Patescibacteria group bacterium]|nr:hypothetical protein [Patescibacteria group bacterium]MBU1500592.1 hypothetical protein [Patescibacteria group bacterium]MBU2080367.1 hypothetical protein [Patescibacteria group bacterium]MBU2124221.1 hypothetical protein [Patescibacteria group bacterium]MBU2194328.1 hypothetical protein [Patescibacteria group bacterium]
MKISLNTKALLKHLSYGEHIRPARDWFTLLSVAVFLSACSLAWNLWLLHTVKSGGVIGSETVDATFDTRPIESVQGVFEERRNEELRFTQEYRFVDPSR